ncbi:hypothetical protein MLD38_004311 [Melastoma candidum]|uniref:Uncharacterized protein n=1 Tax=Melastoma candidum TaxID=119954 RepID=A0ACB9S8I3_9MYRT|nr:hypothetical protein MLD38_004311 [Melastoma candidum]
MDSERDDIDEVMLPGFRFHPTDEELVGFYLKRKVHRLPLSIELIRQLDIYKYDPWDLPKLATTGEKEWYFYCPRDRKYRNSTRPNRVTEAGFWKATGTDRPIYSSHGSVSRCIGLKKSLVFYRGRSAKGIKTDWMMHEFRLPSPSDAGRCSMADTDKYTESWAICRIFRKTSNISRRPSVLTTHTHQPFFSQQPTNHGAGVDEKNTSVTGSHHNQQLHVARQNPVIEEPCRLSFSNDGHYFSLDPSKLMLQTQLDNISLPLPSMPSSVLGDGNVVIPHLPSDIQMRSNDTEVRSHGSRNEEQLPIKSIGDGNVVIQETWEGTNLFDFDFARNSTGLTAGDENAWISNLTWDYDYGLPSWPTLCDLPTYTTNCYT